MRPHSSPTTTVHLVIAAIAVASGAMTAVLALPAGSTAARTAAMASVLGPISCDTTARCGDRVAVGVELRPRRQPSDSAVVLKLYRETEHGAVLRSSVTGDAEDAGGATRYRASFEVTETGSWSIRAQLVVPGERVAEAVSRRLHVYPDGGMAVTMRSDERRPRHGEPVRLRGALTEAANGRGVADVAVELASTTDGGTSWVFSTYTTGEDGVCEAVVTPGSRTTYRWLAPGSASPPLTLAPRPRISPPSLPATASTDAPVTIAGSIEPALPSASTSVTLELCRMIAGEYRPWKNLLTTASDDGGRTRYAASIRLPAVGEWAVRAYHTDGDLERTYTGWSRVKCVEGERADVTVALVGDSTFETLYLDAFQNPSLARHDGLGPTYDGRLHHLLRRELAEKADAVGTVNFAVTGSTSRSALRSGQWGECMSARPDVVLINFGINDQGAGIGTEEYRSNLRTMVRQARRAGMRPVLVGFMWWDYPAHTLVDWNTLLSPYASVIAEVAREDDVLLIDPAPRFREALRQGRWDLWGHNDETYLSAWEDGSEPGTRRHHTNVHEWIPGAQLLAETVADGLVSSGILSGMTPDGVDRTPSRR